MKYLAIVSVAILLSACSSIDLKPGAESVLVSKDPPAESCKFLGAVYGGQGNWWTDDITSTENLVRGSRHDLMNRAYAMSANYVYLQNVEHDTSYLGGGKIGLAGNAYHCPRQ